MPETIRTKVYGQLIANSTPCAYGDVVHKHVSGKGAIA